MEQFKCLIFRVLYLMKLTIVEVIFSPFFFLTETNKKGEHPYHKYIEDYFHKCKLRLQPLLVGLTASIGIGEEQKTILRNFSFASPLYPRINKAELK